MSETSMGGADELRELFKKAEDAKIIGKETGGLLTGHLGHVVIAGAAGAALEDIMASEVTLVTVLVDRSSSIGARRLEDAVRAGQSALLDAFVGSKERDSILVALWTFATSVSVVHSYVPAKDATRLDGKNYRSSGSTVLYDVWCDALAANVAYAQRLRDGGTPSKSVVVVVTDGEDTGSKRTQADCARISKDLLASESFVLAFVGVGRDVNFRAVAKGMGVPDGCIAEEKTATPSALRHVFQMVSKSAIRTSQGMVRPGAAAGFFLP
ncbi:MAG: VWA domain-containing protein [Deltaproteobacteria bacterium]|nr:VWA domain-containing protein [Deltaproteobacteria bacterium]